MSINESYKINNYPYSFIGNNNRMNTSESTSLLIMIQKII